MTMTLTRYPACRARANAAVRPISDSILRCNATASLDAEKPSSWAHCLIRHVIAGGTWISADGQRRQQLNAALGQQPRRARRRSVAAVAAMTLALTLGAERAAQAQGQPQAVTQPGQVFEEEIVPQRYANNPDVNAFIDDLVGRYDFDSDTLHAIFNQVSYSATAVKLVTPSATPAAKNWITYRNRFIEPIRINGGVSFWNANRAALDRATATYGVPQEIIVAIIGVETLYGRYMGNFRVLDALTTLAFDYPDVPNKADREALFKKNLEDLLVWTHTANIDPRTVQGSYAGAVGIPQFMPSSILQYAVDFDGSNNIDLTNSPTDAIGSVANFLKQSGWETGQPIMWQIAPDDGSQGIAQAAADGKPEPHWALDQLLRAGMLLNQPSLDLDSVRGTPVTVVDLPSPARPTQFALGLQNFYVITRYNRSFFYATAVYQLAQAIKARMNPAISPADALGRNGSGANTMSNPNAGASAGGSSGNNLGVMGGMTPPAPTQAQ